MRGSMGGGGRPTHRPNTPPLLSPRVDAPGPVLLTDNRIGADGCKALMQTLEGQSHASLTTLNVKGLLAVVYCRPVYAPCADVEVLFVRRCLDVLSVIVRLSGCGTD